MNNIISNWFVILTVILDNSCKILTRAIISGGDSNALTISVATLAQGYILQPYVILLKTLI